MAVLSVDLAFSRWSDLGIVVLDRARPRAVRSPSLSKAEDWLAPHSIPDRLPLEPNLGPAHAENSIACEILPWNEPGLVDANILAGRLNHLCGARNIRIMVLDGPQAWKSSHSDLKHARMSERQLNTPAKTGLPGMVKPGTYRPFAEFCLDVYDALCRRGWRRLETSEQPSATQSRVLVESYPHAAWKALGIKPLPSKRRARVSDLAEAFAALRALMPIVVNRPPNHDQMQAIVGGLPGLALEERNSAGARIVGTPPRREEGHWREGFIVLPIAPRKPLAVRWLD
jgi:hypothetical protein